MRIPIYFGAGLPNGMWKSTYSVDGWTSTLGGAAFRGRAARSSPRRPDELSQSRVKATVLEKGRTNFKHILRSMTKADNEDVADMRGDISNTEAWMSKIWDETLERPCVDNESSAARKRIYKKRQTVDSLRAQEERFGN